MTTTSSQSIRPQLRTIDGLSIRYAESAPRPDHALLLNPWPESLYAYEATWSRLAERTHLVAIDMPGFGHSERRESLMSPRAMLHERLPNSKLDLLDTGHFTWEDGADQYAALVTSWWAGGYAAAGKAR